ncbi:unnamed protein product [Symbiodinium natans]|uniref:Reverse transcriptase n=1 Tax=Symbiodinium natans TaxID=878477 RepID=A0A812QJK3_9DINO|nr:unnamed protein product [Symbiodinium natans]
MEMQDPHVGSHDVVPPFHLHELKQAIKNLRHGKAADCNGLVLEMFSFASDNLLTCLLGLYNKVLSTGYVEQSWKNTVFTMLPKAGDKSLVQNWRPIAVLKITYKIFSKLLLGRLAPLMWVPGSNHGIEILQPITNCNMFVLQNVLVFHELPPSHL